MSAKKSFDNNMKQRIASEARACVRITNNDLVCKDCGYRFPDSKVFGNTARCKKFTLKPTKVLKGGSCDEYLKVR